MAKYQNSKEHFWNSLNPNFDPIVCPCCGSTMSLQYSASYRLKLTKNACSRLNEQLSLYRKTLQTVEYGLKRLNSPAFENSVKGTSYPIYEELLDFHGSYITVNANNLSKVIKDFDIEQIDNTLKSIPKITSINEEKGQKIDEKKFLQLLQPPHISAGIVDLTLEQSCIDELITNIFKPTELLNKIQTGSHSDENIEYLYNHLNKIFPYILKYCEILVNIPGVDDGVLQRIVAILTAYFGDTEGDKEAPKGLNIPKFTFGTFSLYRNWHSFASCITSFYYLSTLTSKFDIFVKYIHENKIDTEEYDVNSLSFILGNPFNYDNYTSLTEKVPNFKEIILDSVDFVCSGPPVAIPKDAKYISRKDNNYIITTVKEEMRNEVESEVCGWVPKEKCTESLLLMGGTASGKTTLLQSTLVQLKNSAPYLGMHFQTCSPLSHLLLEYYQQQYMAQEWDGATENGSRTSIQIMLQESTNPDSIYYLVINDIAGERFEEMSRKEKEFDEIQAPLTMSNNILFLFDLIAWRQLYALLTDSTESNQEWEAILEERKRQNSVGRAYADSHDLLKSLVNRIRNSTSESEKDEQKLIDRTFILAIPKCDLYIKEEMFLEKWIKSLLKKEYVAKLDDTPVYDSTWNFSKEEEKNVFESALNRIKEISDLASSAILDLASEQEEEQETKTSAEKVAKNINSTLIFLNKIFKEVKVVPVSALGRKPEENENVEGDFKVKAYPLFCEALLLLPMINMNKEEINK